MANYAFSPEVSRGDVKLWTIKCSEAVTTQTGLGLSSERRAGCSALLGEVPALPSDGCSSGALGTSPH